MTENTRNNDDFWGEDVDDDEQTIVAVNPLHRGSQAPHADLSRSQSRSLSSFGTPRPSHAPGSDEHLSASGRPSLYDRLLQSGALDQGMTAEAKRESSRPLDAGLTRSQSLNLPPAPDLRDLAEALEGDEGRSSTEELRESDLDVISAVPKPARLPRSAQVTPRQGLPRPIPQVPSMLLGPGASTRNDVTERFSHMPSTHPLANSIAPTAPSVRPVAPEKRTPAWLVAAAALLLVGVGAAIGRLRAPVAQPAPEEQRAAAAAPAKVEAPAVVAAPVPAAALEAQEAELAAQPAVEPMPVAPVEEPAQIAQEPEKIAAASPSPADEKSEHREHREHRSARSPAATVPEVQALDSAKPAEPSAPVAPAVEAPAAVAAIAEPVKPRERATGPLPAQPSREQVVEAMERTLPALTQCTGDKHGTANVTLTVRSQGAVSYALVGGTFAGTPEGSCIARVIKQAAFPEFTDPSIRVTYPFQL